mgnify:CR=1 FL=1
MRFKRLLALLVSAALALSLLAGCGGGKALSQVIVDLLDGLYANVSVEADSDLTAALKKAAAEGGTEEEILSRMIEILNHNGGSITFTRLGSGQQGDHAVTLYFQTGTDPDAAARNALAQWASVLGTLPDDGSYQGDVAMIESENGYYIALDVEVLKAGKPDKPDKDDDKEPTPDPQPQDSVVDNEDGSVTYNVATEKGFMDWAKAARTSPGSTNCTLLADIDLTNSGEWTPINNFDSTFDGGNHSIEGLTVNQQDNSNVGMFTWVQSNGVVKDLTLTDVQIKGGSFVGSIAGVNSGSIENCNMESGEVTANDYVGGLVGWNYKDIKGCAFSGSVSSNNNKAGGLVGWNDVGTIQDCTASGSVSGHVDVGLVAGYNNSGIIKDCTAEGFSFGKQAVGGVVGTNLKGTITNCHSTAAVTGSESRIGGVVGDNNTDGRVIACSSTETVTGEGNNSTYIGGVAGINFSQIIGCYATGSVSGNAYIGGVVGNNSASGGVVTACYHAIGAVSCTNTIPEAGGVVGRCYGKVVDCYWSGDVTLTPDSSGTYKPHGLGKTTNQINSASNVNATEVTGNDWTDAMTTMNEELSSYGWQYQGHSQILCKVQ